MNAGDDFLSGDNDDGFYDLGNLLGALAVGGASAGRLATVLDPTGNPAPFTWNDRSMNWNYDWGLTFTDNWNNAMTTGPTIGGAGLSSAGYASGLDTSGNQLLNHYIGNPSPNSPGYSSDDNIPAPYAAGHDGYGDPVPFVYAPYAEGYDEYGFPVPTLVGDDEGEEYSSSFNTGDADGGVAMNIINQMLR